jgi:hypothetical protein
MTIKGAANQQTFFRAFRPKEALYAEQFGISMSAG